jgi:hypothetical protein
MKRLHSWLTRSDIAVFGEVISQDWNRRLFLRATKKLLAEVAVAIYGSRTIHRRYAGSSRIPTLARLQLALLWAFPALRSLVVLLSVVRPPQSVGRGISDRSFLHEYQQRILPYQAKSGPSLGYRLVDVMLYWVLSRLTPEDEGQLRAPTREPWESDISLRWEPVLDRAVAGVRSSFPDLPDFDYGLANRLGVGATVHTLGDGRHTVTITAITPAVLLRAVKYYVVFITPSQRVYYDAVRLLLPTFVPERRLLAEDLERLFSSVAAGGPPDSRALRLNVTGVMLQTNLVIQSLQFLVLHECAHMLADIQKDQQGLESEMTADAWALAKLIELNVGEEEALESAYGRIMTAASPANRRRLALPKVGAAPLSVQAAAHTLAISALCSGNPTQIDVARRRILFMVDSACPAAGDAVRDDLGDSEALLGFLLNRAWSSHLDLSSLELLLQRLGDNVASD